MMSRKFYVSYQFIREDNASGCGSCEVEFEGKLKKETIDLISNKIKEDNKFKNIIITFLLELEE